jgi:hypothetical protein
MTALSDSGLKARTKIRAGLSAFTIVLTSAAIGSCVGGGNLAPLPLDITVAASKLTASVGDTIAFTASAQGSSLFGVIVDFGDSQTAAYDGHGARTIKIVFGHAFDAKGTYLVRVTASDVSQGSKDASLQIAVP